MASNKTSEYSLAVNEVAKYTLAVDEGTGLQLTVTEGAQLQLSLNGPSGAIGPFLLNPAIRLGYPDPKTIDSHSLYSGAKTIINSVELGLRIDV
jgi:hypothetical protein